MQCMNENFVFKVADSIREAIGLKKAALHEPILFGKAHDQTHRFIR